MKTRILLTALLLFAALPLVAVSKQPPGSSHPNQETRLLQRLLQMEPDELAQLRQTIERIERMSPEEKERMRARIGQLERMQPEQARALRDFYQALSEDERERMRQNWRALSREERREWRQTLRQMPPEARVRILQENGFLPTPPPDHEGRKGPADPAK
jgi:uncharacterized protein (UPF0335 family)